MGTDYVIQLMTNLGASATLLSTSMTIGHNGQQWMTRHSSCPIRTSAVTVPG